MSIKNSLRLSLILLASLPLIFMTILTYIISYNKYVKLAENSASDLARTYGTGFDAQLNVQIAEIESLSHGLVIQNLLLENYNGPSLGVDSSFYTPVCELLTQSSAYMNNTVSFYLYDVQGYLVASSDQQAKGDWSEYMDSSVSSITQTTIMKSSNINKNNNSIELITPVYVKNTIVGLLRANITSDYFGAFIPKTGDAFILTQTGDYLFSATGLSSDTSLESEAFELFSSESESESGFLTNGAGTINDIYGYYIIKDLGWIYLIRQDGSNYREVTEALPITLIVTLVLMLLLAFLVSRILVNKYTYPIFHLKGVMTEAASGNLDVISDINTNNEFGELSDNFNTMMGMISSNYKELEESKIALENSEKEIKKNYDEIEQLAYHDVLTGLYNRAAFIKYSNEILNNSGATLSHHAVFFLDLDNFKNVNDTLGHDYGDLLLQQVSQKLASYTDEQDIFARTGGDEFLILKTDYESIQQLKDFATKLVDIAGYPFDLDGETAHISISIGISLFPNNGLSISELVKNADIAMYSAKTTGKNNYRFFNSYMEDDFNRRNDLADILATVIPKKEVFLQYQPQASITDGHITGYEALMRIDSEVAGYISPSEFIPIAEDSGAIIELGEWALYEACRFNQDLIERGYGPLKVSVNVSTTQLRDHHLYDIIESIPTVTGMELTNLEIEITESVLMNSLEHNLKLINEIKSLGVSIALDDFGTGYSSFNYLTQIPIDTLKIDKSFIDGICNNEKDKCIADSIINLAHKMDISVVAEGVEDVEQLRILQSQFCDTLQGYLFSKPLASSQFVDLLEKEKGLK
ncbi:MAG: EAL domain-containing protein [Eubacteriales bacterium]|nr:EAL domain-containing protein [Lachnospiraceae bacterium]MDO5126479.1 EAL domain-containing protein [Eubacteriales bacterium]